MSDRTDPDPGWPGAAGPSGRAGGHDGDPVREPQGPVPSAAGPRAADGTGEDVVTELRNRVAELDDSLRRVLADADNMRKRHAREIGRAKQEGQAQVAGELLPVLDNLDRALQYAGTNPDAVIEGVRAVRDQAMDLVSRLGFPRRDDLGVRFDPARHDAVATRRDTGAQPGTVVEVVQPAYGEGERQLRPALVVVAQGD
jgi:molecular chaperone GrpE